MARVLDGGLATALQAEGLPLRTPVNRWLLDLPRLVEHVQRQFVIGGAQGLLTGTFRTLAPIEPKWREAASAAADIACRAASGQAWVWGSIGPSGADWERLTEREQGAWRDAWGALAGHIQDRVHGFVLETFLSEEECQQALQAVKAVCPDIAVVACLVPNRTGRLSSGEPLRPALDRLRFSGADLVGLNCAPPETIAQALPSLNDIGPLWLKPSMSTSWLNSVGSMGDRCEWLGGCCGVPQAQIAQLAGHLSE